MFVQSEAAINHKHRNGLAIRQRRGSRETLVQWANGEQRWIPTSELQGRVVLIGDGSYEDE